VTILVKDKLTDKQRKWILYYKQGKSATEAVKLAGYKIKNPKSAEVIGSENLSKLKDYIVDREQLLDAPDIATMEDINRFWTETMNNKDLEMKDRLKASELRARAAGGFIDRKQVDVKGGSVVFISGDEDIAD
jgi:phage terminase small subunit